ncbi:DUF5058 family protein [Acetanaerobacterium elongatum]|nr:DUF5058 family protein [Acetanaerobacterium elongatum]
MDLMEDFKNSALMFGLGTFVAVFVIAQSVFFLVKAVKRGKELGIAGSTMKKTAISSAIFSITPSISILLALITLSKALGVALPWIRLSVLGAVTYELPAAEAAANAFGLSITGNITDIKVFAAIIWVMTSGCITPLVIIPLFLKKLRGGLNLMKKHDEKWGDIFITAMFLGMISAFLGMGISNGLLSVLTLISSAVIMAVCGLLIKKCGAEWLRNYALPFSMIGAMALAILFNKVV